MPRLDYPYIRAWGHYMGSQQYYIDDEVQRARDSKAPSSAIHIRQGSAARWDGKSWATVEDIASESLRDSIKKAGDAL